MENYVKVKNIDDCFIYNNHTYLYMKHRVNWYNAKHACEAVDGHLLIINDKAENDFIKQIVDNNTWLGLTDVENEDFWKWVDNTFLMWSDWGEGQPNNSRTENYAHYYSRLNYAWNDTNRRSEFYFICEIDKEIDNIAKLRGIKTNIINALLDYKAKNSVAFYKNVPGCYQYNGHTYFYIDTQVNWKAAKAVCENMGGHLLIIENEPENSFIKKILDANTWLGLTDEETESAWKWINGEPLRFSDWKKGQPDNHKELEHYAHYTPWSEYYNWNDIAYTNEYKFICEYDVEISDVEELIALKTALLKNIDVILERDDGHGDK